MFLKNFENIKSKRRDWRARGVKNPETALYLLSEGILFALDSLVEIYKYRQENLPARTFSRLIST